jgi:hypothetical protein
MIRQPRFHRGRDSETGMNTAKVVIRKVQGDSGFQVRQLLAERIGEPRKAPKLHPHGQVLPLYKAGRNVPRIRVASPHLGYNLDDWAWGIPRIRVMLAIVAKQFDELREVNVQTECERDAFGVVAQAVRCDLDATGDTVIQVPKKRTGHFAVPFPNDERRNQFSFLINRHVNPLVAQFGRIVFTDVTRLFLNEGPNFVNLQIPGAQITHSGIHQSGAALTSNDQQPHDGISVESCQPLRAANRAAFKKALNRTHRCVGIRGHSVSRQSSVSFAERGFAGSAAPALDSALSKVSESLAGCMVTACAGHIGLVFPAGQADNDFASALRLTPRAEQPRFSVRADDGADLCVGGGGVRTLNLPISNRLLCPVELRPRKRGIQKFAPLNALCSVVQFRWVSHSSSPSGSYLRPKSLAAPAVSYLVAPKLPFDLPLIAETRKDGMDRGQNAFVRGQVEAIFDHSIPNFRRRQRSGACAENSPNCIRKPLRLHKRFHFRQQFLSFGPVFNRLSQSLYHRFGLGNFSFNMITGFGQSLEFCLGISNRGLIGAFHE